MGFLRNGLLFIALTIMPMLVIAEASQVITRNIPYTQDGQRQLDLFLPDADIATLHPVAIVMHGGGWSRGHRRKVEFITQWLNEQGIAAITVDYSLAPEHKWPAQITDVAQGVWWLKKNAAKYGIDSNRIIAMGGSAGGHLAAMLGQVVYTDVESGIDSRIHAVVSFWGPWNLVSADAERQNKVIRRLLAVDDVSARVDASPAYRINGQAPPTLIFHGTEDTLVPLQQSQQACELYKAKGLDHCLLIPFEGLGHQWPKDSNRVYEPMERFLKQWGFIS